MKLKRTGALLIGASMLFATAQAAYDPIDKVQIIDADTRQVTFIKDTTALFGKVYLASYDEEGRLTDVNSGEFECIGNELYYDTYTYAQLGIDPETVKVGSKVMLWSTYTNSLRPASNTYTIEWKNSTISDYRTENNNPTMIVKKIFASTDDDDAEIYTVVGYHNGCEVRYTVNENTLIAKMTEPFNGSREYCAEVLWNAEYKEAELTEILEAGDIVGYDRSANIFMIMVDADELINGVKTGAIPDLYNMQNWGVSSSRDNFIMGPLEAVSYMGDSCFVSAQNYHMYVTDDVTIINVAEDGTVSISDEYEYPGDLVPFDEETNTGDYVYARYSHKGILQEMYIYRFE